MVIVVCQPRPAQHRRDRALPGHGGLGLTARDVYLVHDELTGQTWRWGQHAFVRLTHDDPAHILTLIRYGSRSARPGLGGYRTGLGRRDDGTADPQVADQVLRYISNARWFAGKGRRVEFRSLTPLPWLTEVSEFFRPAAAPGSTVRDRRAGLPARGGSRAARCHGQPASGGSRADAGIRRWRATRDG